MIYRMVLQTSPGRVDTGATYPQCSPDNPAACQPQQFASVQDAIDYASANGETPVLVASAADAWDIAAGRRPIAPEMILAQPSILSSLMSNPIALGVGALLLLKMFRR